MSGMQGILKLKKGAPKTQGLKDLDYFRAHPVEGREEFAWLFEQVYGAEPRELTGILFHPTPEEAFSCGWSQWNKGGLVHKDTIDGFVVRARDPNSPHGYRDYKPGERKCPYHAGERTRTKEDPGCQPFGFLTVFLQPLVKAAVQEGLGSIGPVTFETHSLHDVLYIHRWLMTLYEQRQSLGIDSISGVIVTISRVERTITMRWAGRRKKQKRSMIGLALDPSYTDQMLDFIVERGLSSPTAFALPDNREIVEQIGDEASDFAEHGYSDDGDNEYLGEEAIAQLSPSQKVTPSRPNDEELNKGETRQEAREGPSQGEQDLDDLEAPESPEKAAAAHQEGSEGGHKWTSQEITEVFKWGTEKMGINPPDLLAILGVQNFKGWTLGVEDTKKRIRDHLAQNGAAEEPELSEIEPDSTLEPPFNQEWDETIPF